MIYLELFWSFFQVGLFSIGGGYAAMPLIQDQVVDIHPWLTMTGFADIMAIAEMTPGPIALNAATFVGIQVAGLPGALIATIGCLFPSCVIVMTLAYVYYRFRGLSIVQGVLAGLRPAVIAMIASAGISLLILALYGQRTLPADQNNQDDVHGEKASRLESRQHHSDGQQAILFQNGPCHIDDHIKDNRRHTGQHTGHSHAHILVGAKCLVESRNDGNDNQWRQCCTNYGNQCTGDSCHMVTHQNRGIDGDRAGAGLGNRR